MFNSTKKFETCIVRKLSGQNGSAMIFVVVLAVLLNIVIGAVFFSTRFTVKKSGGRRENVNLFNIAEAGKEDGLAKLKSGEAVPVQGQRIQVTSSSNFNGGSYVVSCSSNVALDTLQLVSTARYLGKTKIVEGIYAVSVCSPAGPAFDNGISAGGDIAWSGSGSVVASANIFCNGSFNMNGSSTINADVYACGGLSKSGSCDINGNVWASSVSQSGSGSVSGTVTIGPVAPIAIPDIDPTPYYNHAVSNGQVFSSSQHISGSSDYTVPGGIMWVNGSFKRSGSGNFIGCVIATGNINCSGSGDYIKVNEYPIAFSVNGNIDFSGSGTVNGLLYSRNGNFEKTGSGNVVGSIICKGNVRKSGSWNFLTFQRSAPVPPGCNGNLYALAGWKEY